jgi:hypothetical protein
VSKLKPGETFEVDPSEWLFEWESQISPL